MILIIYPDVDIWNFVITDLYPRSDVQLFPLRRNTNVLQRIIRRLSPLNSVPASVVLGHQLRMALSKLKAGDRVILCEYTDPILVSAIDRSVHHEVARYCWLWNHKGLDCATFVRNLEYMRQRRFQCMTYDESDAEHYQLGWHPQFFCVRRYLHGGLQALPPKWDFFFVGYVKQRGSEIQAMQLLLSAFNTSFTVVHNNSEYIPYANYMEQASQSRCIVDIVKTGECSCTLRPLEALALHKKLITNNPSVRNYTFYHPQNIFIFGVDDVTTLPRFIQTPFVELSAEIVDGFDVTHWVNLFLK